MQQFILNTRKTTRRPDAAYGIDLRIVRHWFAPEGDGQQGEAGASGQSGGQQQSGAGASSAGTQTTENHIPQSRFNEVNEEKNRALDELKKLQKQLADQEKSKLEEQGNFRKLADDAQAALSAATPVVEKYRALEAKAKARNEARVKALPEHARKLVPAISDPLELQAWLDEAEPIFKLPQPADTDAGKQGDKKTSGDGYTGTKEHQQSVTQRFRL